MTNLRNGAISDYNLTIESIKNVIEKNHQGLVTVVECGVPGKLKGPFPFQTTNKIIIKDKNVSTLRPISNYQTAGNATPLLDAINLLIDNISDDVDEDTAFLIMVITDGANNVNAHIANYVANRIRNLQYTDRWTFTFRVPRGYAQNIRNLGVPEGNIMEWELSEKGLKAASEATQIATSSYFNLRSRGMTSNSSFYTDLSNVSISEIKKNLEDITDKVQILWVSEKYDKKEIRDFCIEYFGEYKIGSAYYQLNKPEKIQASKKICIKHKKSGKTYSGDDARDLLGLPYDREVRVSPKDHGQYEVFIQSTSVNRHLVGDTRLLYFI
jgi:hypothetical protein